jgi:hypothetical protein
MKRCLVFLFATLFLTPLWAADDPKPGAFSGAMVYTGREGGLLLLELPLEVYQGFRRPDLGDIRIFDASENPVPFIMQDKPKKMFTPPPQEVPFFMWDGGSENKLPGNTDIEINTSGGVVRIKNQNNVSKSAQVFLVDCSSLSYAPETLKVLVDNQGENFNSLVAIHHSADLSNWSPLGNRQMLAFFGRTVQDTLALDGSRDFNYLLLTFESQTPVVLGMTVSFKQQQGAPEYHEVTIKGKKSSDGKRVNYNTESFYPIELIDFILPDADSMQIIVKSRMNENDEWNVRASGTIFRYVSSGEIVKNSFFEISGSGSRDPFWEIEAAGDLPFNSALDCVIRWKVRELIFPARGRGPWTLAYGNSACSPLNSGELLPAGSQQEFEQAIFTGEKRYEKTPLTTPKENKFREYFLWAFLGTAVVILLILSYSIAKSMKK